VLRVSDSSPTVWDARLDSALAWSPYNYSGWAAVKALDGWDVLRLEDELGYPLCQLLFKQLTRVAVVAYCPGGFVADPRCGPSQITEFIRERLGCKVVYLRTHMIVPISHCSFNMRQAGWRPVRRPLAARGSLLLSLESPEEIRREKLSPNWGRNLRRGESRDNSVIVTKSADAKEVSELHQRLEDLKGVRAKTWARSQQHVSAALQGYGDRLVIARCVGPSGDVRAIRGAVLTGACAFDFLAAASISGRKHYSSHVTLWRLVGAVAERGARLYDMGGVDAERNRGVYDFKHGIGSEPLAYSGEFEHVVPSMLHSVVGQLVRQREVA